MSDAVWLGEPRRRRVRRRPRLPWLPPRSERSRGRPHDALEAAGARERAEALALTITSCRQSPATRQSSTSRWPSGTARDAVLPTAVARLAAAAAGPTSEYTTQLQNGIVGAGSVGLDNLGGGDSATRSALQSPRTRRARGPSVSRAIATARCPAVTPSGSVRSTQSRTSR